MTENLIIVSVFHYVDGDEVVRVECGHGSKAETLVKQGDVSSIDAAISAVIVVHEKQVCGLEATPDVTFEMHDEWPSCSYFLSESRKDLDRPYVKIEDFVGGPEELAKIQGFLRARVDAVSMAVTCECDPQLRITTKTEGVSYTFSHDETCPEMDAGPRVAAVEGYMIHD